MDCVFSSRLRSQALIAFAMVSCQSAAHDEILEGLPCDANGRCTAGYTCVAEHCTSQAAEPEPQGGDPRGTTGDGGTGQPEGGGGARPHGGSGGEPQGGAPIAPTCGTEPTPPGGGCPAVCSGGCVDATCIIDCEVGSACDEPDIACPQGFACAVDCGDGKGCKDRRVLCPATYTCSVQCDGNCQDTVVECGSGVCHLTCGADADCEETTLTCANEQCSATCDAQTSGAPTVNCNEACGCVACGG